MAGRWVAGWQAGGRQAGGSWWGSQKSRPAAAPPVKARLTPRKPMGDGNLSRFWRLSHFYRGHGTTQKEKIAHRGLFSPVRIETSRRPGAHGRATAGLHAGDRARKPDSPAGVRPASGRQWPRRGRRPPASTGSHCALMAALPCRLSLGGHRGHTGVRPPVAQSASRAGAAGASRHARQRQRRAGAARRSYLARVRHTI